VVELVMSIKQTKQANKLKWYPGLKKEKPDKVLLKSAVGEFLAKGGQITKCAVGTKKP
jgi:hypothetical protein